MAIRQVNQNHIQGVDWQGNVLAEARRSAPGNLWYVWMSSHKKNLRSRNETPHVRVSGKLPELVQKKLVIAALTATTGIQATEEVARRY